MDTSTKIRFGFIAALWLVLVWLVVSSQPFTLWTLFMITVSGIVVWVPLYKKYIKNDKGNKQQ
ncbi:MAG: hypothetical protein NC039_05665 [Muribaculaceae bacterium]|nr:hypothetical protein [Muribaculaceae bacterium]